MTHSGRGSPGRRRSWRRRQLRRRRIFASCVGLLGVAITAWLAFPSRHHSSDISTASDWSPTPTPASTPNYAALAARIPVPRQTAIHHYPIYNYSVVRGGVHSAEELRQAIAHDRAVAQHYARFQYEHARLVRLQKPALVYLSYRMNDKIFWTRTRHRLTPGEELITDGTITARTKCANQVSTRKQLAVSPEEPPAAALEQIEPPPLLPPAETKFPALYKEALLTPAPPAPWVGPALGPAFPFVGPPLPSGRGPLKPACESKWKENQEDKLGIHDDESKETDCPKRPPRKPPAAVPEPGTWALMGSGLAAVLAFYRKRKHATTLSVH